MANVIPLIYFNTALKGGGIDLSATFIKKERKPLP